MNRTLTFFLASALCMASQAQWTSGPDIPAPPFNAGHAFVIGSTVYVGVGNNLYGFNTMNQTWSTLATFPGAGNNRQNATAFAIGGLGYVGLGSTQGSVFRKDLWAYDPTTNTWTQKAEFPGTERGGASAFVIGDKAYVCGGTSQGGTFNEVYRYDPVANAWSQVSTLPTGNRGFTTAFAIGDHGYVYGGYTGFGNETNQLHRYDPATNTWAQRAMYPGGGRQSAVGFVVSGKAIVGTGHAGFQSGFDSFYSYDPGSDTWTVADAYPGGQRWGALGGVVGTTVYMGSGANMSFTLHNDWRIWSPAVSIEEVTNDAFGLLVYPNPAEELLTITSEAVRTGGILVRDPLGRIMLQDVLVNGSCQMDLSGFAPGVLLVQVSGENDRVVQSTRVIRK